jgi:hypothetical protein
MRPLLTRFGYCTSLQQILHIQIADFDVFLTVHLSIFLVINKLNAQILVL